MGLSFDTCTCKITRSRRIWQPMAIVRHRSVGVHGNLVLQCISLFSISNPHDSPTWDRIAAIKSNILRRWDAASSGVRVCCIKFAQRVVQVQTPGIIADPRVREPGNNIGEAEGLTEIQRSEQNEVSLALVPRDHPLIPPSRLEPEALGLLDRLLNVFHEETRYVLTT